LFLVGIDGNFLYIIYFLQGEAVQVPESRAPAHHSAPSSRLQALKILKSCLRDNGDYYMFVINFLSRRTCIRLQAIGTFFDTKIRTKEKYFTPGGTLA
jgi:hypothetical protein